MTGVHSNGPLGSMRADLERRFGRRKDFENVTIPLLAAFSALGPADRSSAIAEIRAWLCSDNPGEMYDASALVRLVPIPELADELALTAERLSQRSLPIYQIVADEWARAANELRAKRLDL